MCVPQPVPPNQCCGTTAADGVQAINGDEESGEEEEEEIIWNVGALQYGLPGQQQ